ncbi:hypothetical protein [Mycobacterium sp.]|uniref:hypothetical protein n=1 Tax=Mycobacterium sp. TaxID=1785 RepID=UPI003D14B749
MSTVECRYCDKCHGMFYDGSDKKGVCPSGHGHHAEGYRFELPVNKPETRVGQPH